MDKITTMGIDLAKRVFALHGVDASGRVVLRKSSGARGFMRVACNRRLCVVPQYGASGATARIF